MDEDRATFTVGDRFSTFQKLRDKISEYEKSNFVQLWKREARTIDAAKKHTVRYPNPSWSIISSNCVVYMKGGSLNQKEKQLERICK